MIRSYQVLRILFYARISSCVLKGFRTQCRVFSFFTSIQGNPKIVILSAITLDFWNKSQISPTLYWWRCSKGQDRPRSRKRTVSRVENDGCQLESWNLLWSLLCSLLFLEDWIAACPWLVLRSRHSNNALTMKYNNWVVMLKLCDIG